MRQVFLWRGKELTWRGVKGVFIGHLYPSEITKKGGHTISSKPDDLGQPDTVSDSDKKKWMALESSAEAQASEAREKKKARTDKGMKEFLASLEPLRETIQAMGFIEKEYFIRFLVDRFTIRKIPSTLKIRQENRRLGWAVKGLQRSLKQAERKLDKRKR